MKLNVSKLVLPILLLSLFTRYKLHAQNEADSFLTQVELVSVTDRIQHLFLSDSAVLFTDLRQIPDSVLLFIIRNNDSLEGKPSTWKTQKPDKTIARFIANRKEEYEATDEISGKGYPARKFVFGIKDSTGLFFYYFHGGLGNHLHLVYVDLNTNRYSAFATLNNWLQVGKHDGEDKIKKWRKALRTPLVSERDVKALNNWLYEDYDVF